MSSIITLFPAKLDPYHIPHNTNTKCSTVLVITVVRANFIVYNVQMENHMKSFIPCSFNLSGSMSDWPFTETAS
jgi:hypothetical protein